MRGDLDQTKTRILLVIDHFGSGGAQKQIVTLAAGLKQKGYSVEFFIYYPEFAFFKPIVDDLKIIVHNYNKKGKGFSIDLLLSLRRVLVKNKYDAVISFLDTPNLYSELASIGLRSLRVIVAERNSYIKENSKLKSLIRRVGHSFSDVVVANSKSQTHWIKNKYPWLREKTYTIYNGYDPSSFIVKPLPKTTQKDLRLIGIGRVAYQKNLLNLIKALDLFYKKHGWCLKISWVGSLNTSAEPTYKDKVFRLLDNLPQVKEKWSWLGERSDVPKLLSEHHALILPSFYEGLPNVVCEALFSGRPAIASDVCDNPILIEDGERGVLFDPFSYQSITSAIERYVERSHEDRLGMGSNARKYAEENLTTDKMVHSYEKLASFHH